MMLLLMISCNSKQIRNHKNLIEIKEQLGQSSYPFIKSMEYHAYIQDNEAIPVIDIQITEKGKTFLAELQNTWNELTESVNQITKTS